MAEIELIPATKRDVAEAALLASSAMIDLPEVKPVFRGKRSRMEAVFCLLFSKNPEQLLLAKRGDEMVGLMRVVAWPHCNPTPLQTLKDLPALFVAL